MVDERGSELVASEFESNARRSKIEQVLAAQARDAARMAHLEQLRKLRAERTPIALGILERFWDSGDVERLKDELQHWSRDAAFAGYGGVHGQMFLNQLVNYSSDQAVLSRLLAQALQVPRSADDAAHQITSLAAYAEAIKRGAHPAPRKSAFFLSFLWSLQKPDDWPCFWPSAERTLVRLGWLGEQGDLGQLYTEFREIMLALGEPLDVEFALYWFDEHKFTGLDPAIAERCRQNLVLYEKATSEGALDDAEEAAAQANARAIIGELSYLGEALADRIAEALGRLVKAETPSIYWRRPVLRADGWVRWAIAGDGGRQPASIRVWVTADHVFVGLHPGHYRPGWYPEAAQVMAPVIPSGATQLPIRPDSMRISAEPNPSWEGEFLLGWHYPAEEATHREFADEVVRRAADLQPALDRLVAAIGGQVSDKAKLADDPLRPLVEQFVAEHGYPSPKDQMHRAERKAMAAVLTPDQVRVMDVADLRRIYSSSHYGSPGPQSALNSTLRDATPAELSDYLERLHFLLWGEGDDAARIDALLDPNDRWIRGLGEAGIMKLLAVAHPERYLPVYPYGGEQGKLRMLNALGLEPPPADASAGQRQVLANDALRRRLDPFFPNDPWGQATFLYWLVERPEQVVDPTDALAALADDLLVSREFIAEVVELLREKKQIVFYGPPGSGKTFVARRLAEVLAPDPTRRAIVQFHPSTSYEDFFEGFRPDEAGGQLSYHLRKGPLALMAERAEAAPSVPHIMLIDEINRANLPKVLGELLFLLEYRGEQVQTLYRPDEPFSLPENLWFIGTMNTADRSIALVDAALRRRFHFIPFFPDEGEMAGLLRRWLERAEQPTWIADLVEMVNAELVEELGGPDLQIGPSYFMRPGIEAALPKVWRYNVEPLVQDQLYGQPDKIRDFSYERVLKRYHDRFGADPAADAEG